MSMAAPEPLFDYPAHFFPIDITHGDVKVKVLKIGWEGVCMDDKCGEPAIIYFHGGGYCGGSPRGYANFCAMLSRMCRARVYSVDYRLVPEHKIEDGVEDCVTVYKWLISNIGQDPANVCLVGDSAGGGLVLAALQVVCGGPDSQFSIATEVIPTPAGAVLISPYADVSFSSKSSTENLTTDPIIGKKLQNVLRKFTLRGEMSDDNDPRVSFIQGMFFETFPPMYVCASETESLYDDAVTICSKAKARGIPVTFDSAPFGVHIYPIFSAFAPEYQDGLEKMARFIRNIFHMDRDYAQASKNSNRPKFIPGSNKKNKDPRSPVQST
eukprot:CAMPEP_0204828606 /NCGR_PEP_ID=MMETSP1346-20131115/6468_1 /ASSEMBLY_ACC=CAM_ASM_000771 /TAXON_ID=215587 /ORGANISM="Aplanochytrium stocchinoi, Strain GSBS06" /LENGTH=324 /DNA_ID=CAMNT_0051957825 /DNA_START=244 /DNA_END=1218 /DNA_ORIENTATION=-